MLGRGPSNVGDIYMYALVVIALVAPARLLYKYKGLDVGPGEDRRRLDRRSHFWPAQQQGRQVTGDQDHREKKRGELNMLSTTNICRHWYKAVGKPLGTYIVPREAAGRMVDGRWRRENQKNGPDTLQDDRVMRRLICRNDFSFVCVDHLGRLKTYH